MTPPPGNIFSGVHTDRIPHRCLIKLKGIYHTLKSAERKGGQVRNSLNASNQAIGSNKTRNYVSPAQS